MRWLLLTFILCGVRASSTKGDIGSNEHTSLSNGTEPSEMAKLTNIMSQLMKTISDCAIDEDSLYRTIADKARTQAAKQTPPKSTTNFRKKLAVPAAPAVDDGTIDRDAFMLSLLDHAAKSESNRKGLSRFVIPMILDESGAVDEVKSALEMMRGCVSFHGYCVKALEAAQELIVSSSICRDLSKNKKREIGQTLVSFRDSTHDRMLHLASQKQVMGDLVRAVISKANTASPSPTTEVSTDVPETTAQPTEDPLLVEYTEPAYDEVRQDIANPGDVLENLLTEWHMVPREAPLPPYEEYEVDSESDDDEYLNIRMKPSTTTEPANH